MPADALQRRRPAEAEQESQGALKPIAKAVSQSLNEDVAKQSGRSLLRKMFEGHEEFLGRTPD